MVLALAIPAQAVLGGITVLTDLNPWVVSLHLVLLAGDRVGSRCSSCTGSTTRRVAPAAGVVPALAWTTYAVTWLVLYAGTVVTGSGPHAGDASSPRNGLDPLQVSQLHADLVFLLIGLTVGMWFALRATGGDLRPVAALAAVEVAQGAVGFVQYFAGLPVAVVMLHMLGAGAGGRGGDLAAGHGARAGADARRGDRGDAARGTGVTERRKWTTVGLHPRGQANRRTCTDAQ